ncbi:MAG: 50S ribosomal protein L6 [Clostridia bacterium]|nr:50S ribosomal protein L6 [Clostridia bacterium]MBR2354294.1 50S ribosomal protein L6 [Clostridia bacterium]MBR2414526.1 50S ribosomal protein L6 [Clostridia bacterium]MBR3955366.1 50S ribosomal protein L6 [Clostridia bacterium]
MSRIGRKPITVPAGVDVTIDGNAVTVKGPKGTLSGTFNSNMSIELDAGVITVSRPNDEKENRALHGLTRTLISNMVEGVSNGFKKELEIVGVGYRAAMEGKSVVLTIGYSHPVKMDPPEGVTIEVPAPNKIVVSGADKQVVGQFACEIRAVRPPEPYKGKGIKYADEVVRRKEGKSGKGGK